MRHKVGDSSSSSFSLTVCKERLRKGLKVYVFVLYIRDFIIINNNSLLLLFIIIKSHIYKYYKYKNYKYYKFAYTNRQTEPMAILLLRFVSAGNKLIYTIKLHVSFR